MELFFFGIVVMFVLALSVRVAARISETKKQGAPEAQDTPDPRPPKKGRYDLARDKK